MTPSSPGLNGPSTQLFSILERSVPPWASHLVLGTSRSLTTPSSTCRLRLDVSLPRLLRQDGSRGCEAADCNAGRSVWVAGYHLPRLWTSRDRIYRRGWS